MKTPKTLLLFFLFIIGPLANAQKIGLLMDSYFIDRWYTDQKLLHDKIAELGGQCITEDPRGDMEEQIRLGRKLIQQKVDVLIIIAVDSHKAAVIVEEAAAANIPVIAYDRFIFHPDLAFYISYNNSQVGKSQAQYALEKVPRGNYLLVNGPVSDNNAVLFREGQLEVLKSSIETKKVNIISDIILNDWNEMEAMMTIAEFLTDSAIKPDVIIAGNDAVATGALQAVPPALLRKIVVVGQDADPMAIRNIIKGDQSMTIYKPIKPLAFRSAEIAMQLAKGDAVPGQVTFSSEGMEVNAILLEPMVVDVKNYKETVIKDGHVKLEAR